jgi:hypothetical protein
MEAVMSTLQVLESELESAPEPLVEEVLQFARALKQTYQSVNREPMLYAQTALNKDWLLAEEDEAWRDL